MTQSIRQYFLLLKWQLLRLRMIIPLFIVVQIMTGIGFIIGLGFIVPDIDPVSALFFVTGGPTLILMIVGFVLVPQLIGEDKGSGSLTYIWSLPVSRITYLFADLTVWIISTLPGVTLSLAVGSWHYGFDLSVGWLALPSVLLISATASCVGYAIAHSVSKPQIISIITQIVVFLLFLFSPVNYPIERLPEWLQSVHAVLPITYMADLMRGSLTGLSLGDLAKPLIIVSAWLIAGLIVVTAVLKRRK